MCVACGSNEYESGGDCVACRVTCGSGEYVSGSCGGASDYGCTACDNGAGVGTEYYTGPASTITVNRTARCRLAVRVLRGRSLVLHVVRRAIRCV